jgi:hypothetical protein
MDSPLPVRTSAHISAHFVNRLRATALLFAGF